jgi:hypothetical protein
MRLMLKSTFAGRLDMVLFGNEFNRIELIVLGGGKKILTRIARIAANSEKRHRI